VSRIDRFWQIENVAFPWKTEEFGKMSPRTCQNLPKAMRQFTSARIIDGGRRRDARPFVIDVGAEGTQTANARDWATRTREAAYRAKVVDVLGKLSNDQTPKPNRSGSHVNWWVGESCCRCYQLPE
jgi:hypothetical protein